MAVFRAVAPEKAGPKLREITSLHYYHFPSFFTYKQYPHFMSHPRTLPAICFYSSDFTVFTTSDSYVICMWPLWYARLDSQRDRYQTFLAIRMAKDGGD